MRGREGGLVHPPHGFPALSLRMGHPGWELPLKESEGEELPHGAQQAASPSDS